MVTNLQKIYSEGISRIQNNVFIGLCRFTNFIKKPWNYQQATDEYEIEKLAETKKIEIEAQKRTDEFL